MQTQMALICAKNSIISWWFSQILILFFILRSINDFCSCEIHWICFFYISGFLLAISVYFLHFLCKNSIISWWFKSSFNYYSKFIWVFYFSPLMTYFCSFEVNWDVKHPNAELKIFNCWWLPSICCKLEKINW